MIGDVEQISSLAELELWLLTNSVVLLSAIVSLLACPLSGRAVFRIAFEEFHMAFL
jgi:hypothetical protein